MAIASSGAIKLGNDISQELDMAGHSAIGLAAAATGTYATINTASSSYPNASAPHLMSEWYSYDHDTASYDTSTDWYTPGWWSTYNKFRWDANYDSSYTTGTTVTDVGGLGYDGAMQNMSASNHTPSTADDEPGYWTFNGTDECIISTDPMSVGYFDPYAYNGWSFFVAFRKHSDHDGTIFSMNDNAGEKIFDLESQSNGNICANRYMGGAWSCANSKWVDVDNNVWKFVAVSFDQYASGRGTDYRVMLWIPDSNIGNADMIFTNQYGTLHNDGLDNDESPAWCIGATAAGTLTNFFEGDISFIAGKNHNCSDMTGSPPGVKLQGWWDHNRAKWGY